MTPRPAILTMDNLDTRREVWVMLLRHLPPLKRVDFLDWCCAHLRATAAPANATMLRHLRADRSKMRFMVALAVKGDKVADAMLANEIYADVACLCHQWSLDFARVALELEQWAKGREPSPTSAFSSLGAGDRTPRIAEPVRLTMT